MMTIDQIPGTPNGKRDLTELQAVLSGELARRADHVEPGTPTERYLARLFEQTLRVEKVGRQEAFLALGGHSLLAFRMQRRIRRDLGREVDAKAILRSPSLGALAQLVDGAPCSA
jgi:hypothetical protein